MDLQALFDQAKQNEVKKTTEFNSGSFKKFSEDERFIQFQPGNTYTFRLLYSTSDERKVPFIEKFTHTYWDDTAEFNKLKIAICPTSKYLLDKRGFKECPICEASSKFYRDGKEGSKSSEELYNIFRRKFHGYALVYVVNDPTNEENNGQIKIMHYGISIHRWLKLQIFGIDEKDNVVDDDTIGVQAFDTKKGYDLKIAVTQTGDDDRKYNKYVPEFGRKLSKVDVTDKDIEKAVKELEFDSEFYENYDKEELAEFNRKYILQEEVKQEGTEEFDLPTQEEDEEDEIPMGDVPEEKVEEPEEEPEVEVANSEATGSAEESGSGKIDIDSILAKVKSN